MQATPSDSARVYGVLFRIAAVDKPALDRVESLGVGYRAEWLSIVTSAGNYTALAYIAIQKEAGLRPYPWYRDIVVAGAVEHGLPHDYIRALQHVPAMSDPDGLRQQAYENSFPEIRTHASLTP